MKRLAMTLLVLTPLLVSACRHFVVERNVGRVDSARSIMSASDEQWTLQSEPEPQKDENR